MFNCSCFPFKKKNPKQTINKLWVTVAIYFEFLTLSLKKNGIIFQKDLLKALIIMLACLFQDVEWVLFNGGGI